MIDTLRLLLSSHLKYSKLTQKTGGFTLIELLVSMVLATLVITPLMGFMINVMDTDRKEQAKATSEHEIQSALDYMAQDLEQAVYIYDAKGLNNNSTTDNTSGIKDQIPPVAGASECGIKTPTCVPVLVFWKREPREKILPVPGTDVKDDTFVYSLVAYYLIKGNNGTEPWSNAARIGRFQVRDGVRDPITPTNNGYPNYVETPSKGFQLFNLSIAGISLSDRMNRWKKKTETYQDPAVILVDFVDENTSKIAPNCPANTQQVPSTLAGGFYACVDSYRTSAQIYIRGNALARFEKDTTYSDDKSIYFPTASIQIKGRGLLNID